MEEIFWEIGTKWFLLARKSVWVSQNDAFTNKFTLNGKRTTGSIWKLGKWENWSPLARKSVSTNQNNIIKII